MGCSRISRWGANILLVFIVTVLVAAVLIVAIYFGLQAARKGSDVVHSSAKDDTSASDCVCQASEAAIVNNLLCCSIEVQCSCAAFIKILWENKNTKSSAILSGELLRHDFATFGTVSQNKHEEFIIVNQTTQSLRAFSPPLEYEYRIMIIQQQDDSLDEYKEVARGEIDSVLWQAKESIAEEQGAAEGDEVIDMSSYVHSKGQADFMFVGAKAFHHDQDQRDDVLDTGKTPSTLEQSVNPAISSKLTIASNHLSNQHSDETARPTWWRVTRGVVFVEGNIEGPIVPTTAVEEQAGYYGLAATDGKLSGYGSSPEATTLPVVPFSFHGDGHSTPTPARNIEIGGPVWNSDNSATKTTAAALLPHTAEGRGISTNTAFPAEQGFLSTMQSSSSFRTAASELPQNRGGALTHIPTMISGIWYSQLSKSENPAPASISTPSQIHPLLTGPPHYHHLSTRPQLTTKWSSPTVETTTSPPAILASMDDTTELGLSSTLDPAITTQILPPSSSIFKSTDSLSEFFTEIFSTSSSNREDNLVLQDVENGDNGNFSSSTDWVDISSQLHEQKSAPSVVLALPTNNSITFRFLTLDRMLVGLSLRAQGQSYQSSLSWSFETAAVQPTKLTLSGLDADTDYFFLVSYVYLNGTSNLTTTSPPTTAEEEEEELTTQHDDKGPNGTTSAYAAAQQALAESPYLPGLTQELQAFEWDVRAPCCDEEEQRNTSGGAPNDTLPGPLGRRLWSSGDPNPQGEGAAAATTATRRGLLAPAGAGAYFNLEEKKFHTQRPPREEEEGDASFSVVVMGDSHYDYRDYDGQLFRRTVENINAGGAYDFLIDIGDTFMGDVQTIIEQPHIEVLYPKLFFRFAEICSSTPLFLIGGNHDGESGIWRDGTKENLAMWATAARRKYFSNPTPGPFYAGGGASQAAGGAREAYYAWTWGPALFVALDAYWYTTKKAQKTENGWAYTLGEEQYRWLAGVLEASTEQFKVVLVHNLLGGVFTGPHPYDGRGGAAWAPYFEWGGRGEAGLWEFDAQRPGWGNRSIHQLLVAANVSLVLKGHDHIWCTEELDGVVYQTLSTPSWYDRLPVEDKGYSAEQPYSFSPGHVVLDVGPDRLAVRHVATESGLVAHTYEIEAAAAAAR